MIGRRHFKNMRLFDESQNKYYDLLAELLNKAEGWSESDYLRKKAEIGKEDWVVDELIFDVDNESNPFFKKENGRVISKINRFPIRPTSIEKQAFKSLLSSEYANSFLDGNTIKKLEKAVAPYDAEWSLGSIEKHNVFLADKKDENLIQINLHLILEIIEARAGMRCINGDNVCELVFPVKVEFSLVEDQFRVCAYRPDQDRFIKINLDKMREIEKIDVFFEGDLEKKYKMFIEGKFRELVLDVTPKDFIVERCFRIFSCYEKEVIYDSDNNKYTLKLRYNQADSEKELIRDILSFGSYLVVLEPEDVREVVIERIKGAYNRYS